MKKKALALLCALVMILGMMPAASAADTPTVTIDGASIRTESPQGLRFKITVTNASQATDFGIKLEYAGKTKTISLANNYTNIYAKDEAADTVEYTAVLINIPSDAFETDVQATGFVTYDGGTQTTDAITRNIQGVAHAAGQELAADGTLSDMGGTKVAVTQYGSDMFYTLDETMAGKTVNVSLKVRVSGMGYGASVTGGGLQLNSTWDWLKGVDMTDAWTTVSLSNYVVPEANANGFYFGNIDDVYKAGGCLYVKDVSVEVVDLSGDIEVDLTGGTNGYGTQLTNNDDGSLTISFDNAYGQMGFALGALKLEDYSSVRIVYKKTGSDSQFQFKITSEAVYGSASNTTYPGYGVAEGVEKTETIDISTWEREGATYLLIGGNGSTDLVLTIYSITLCK